MINCDKNKWEKKKLLEGLIVGVMIQYGEIKEGFLEEMTFKDV